MSVFGFFLVALILLVGLSIVWSTMTTGISPMPSSKKACLAMITLIDKTTTGPIYELGSGWGNLAVHLALAFPRRQIVGYEISIVPWLCSLLIKKLLRLKNLTLYRQDFLTADLSTASVIVCYLFPAAMVAIEKKLASGQNGNGVLISNNFALPSYQPQKQIQLDDFYKSPVYLYRLHELKKERA